MDKSVKIFLIKVIQKNKARALFYEHKPSVYRTTKNSRVTNRSLMFVNQGP